MTNDERAREITVAALVEEVERDDATIAVAAKRGLLLRSPEHGERLLDAGENGPDGWREAGFTSRHELMIAIHAAKSRSEAPMALLASFARFETRQMRREQVLGAQAASSVILPAPAQRTIEQEADAPSIEMGVGTVK